MVRGRSVCITSCFRRIVWGGSEVLVIESNQNHATITDTEVCTTLPASMGMGGGYIPMIVVSYGFDSYNQQVDAEVAQPLRSHDGGDETPKCLIEIAHQYDPVCLDNHPNDSRITIREDGIVQSLTSRCGTGGNNVPLVMIIKN